MNLSRRQDIYFAIGPAVSALLGFLSVPLMTWSLSDALISQFGIFQYSTMGILTLVLLGLDQAFLRNAFIVDDHSVLLKKCIIPVVLALFLLVVIYQAVFFFIPSLNYFYTTGLLVFFNVFMLAIQRFSVQKARASGHGVYYFFSEIILKIPLILFLTYLCLDKSESLKMSSVLFSFVVLGAVLSATYIVIMHRQLWCSVFALTRKCESNPSTTNLVKFGLPLGIAGLLYWCILNSTLFVSNYSLKNEQTAVLVVAISLSNIAVIGQTIFSMIWLPKIYRESAEKNEQLDITRYTRFAIFIASIFFVIVVFSLYIISFIVGDSYSKSAQYAVALSVLPILYIVSEVTYIGVLLKNKTYIALIVGCVSSLFSVFSSFYLANLFGLKGILLSIIASAVLFLLLRTFYGLKFSSGNVFSSINMLIISITLATISVIFLPNEYFFVGVVIILPVLIREYNYLGFSIKKFEIFVGNYLGRN